MNMKKLLLFAALAVILLCTSCRKTCRCYAYDGNIYDFDMEYLQEQDVSCSNMKYFVDNGLTYSMCERVF